MKMRMLAVMADNLNYLPCYEVSVAGSFEEAKIRIQAAEENGSPFDVLDIPAGDEKIFWDFLEWMHRSGRNYPFSIFGIGNTFNFMRIVRKARGQGFTVNT